jgi:TetR/AcrR family transcriptional regulator
MSNHEPAKRQQILHAALRRFAEKGYAGTSVQEIVDAARVTKPTLYYYFRNKADLFGALVDWAHEERYRRTQEAAARGTTLCAQLTGICASIFDFIAGHRDLTRLAFATAFAARGELPAEAGCLQKSLRSFDVVRGLMKQAVATGELNKHFDTEELALGFAGMMHIQIMVYLIQGGKPPNRRTARRLVELFLAGARSNGRAPTSIRSRS